jgi:hypothetical protein
MEVPTRKIRAEANRPGFSGLEITNTELGDRVEAALAAKLGWTPLVGPAAGRARQGAFDLIDENGMYVEVKAVSVFAKEYKIKSGARANTRKTNFGNGHGVKFGTVMAIVEQRPNGKLKAWLYRREGVGCFRLGADGLGWEFVGKVTV